MPTEAVGMDVNVPYGGGSPAGSAADLGRTSSMPWSQPAWSVVAMARAAPIDIFFLSLQHCATNRIGFVIDSRRGA